MYFTTLQHCYYLFYNKNNVFTTLKAGHRANCGAVRDILLYQTAEKICDRNIICRSSVISSPLYRDHAYEL